MSTRGTWEGPEVGSRPKEVSRRGSHTIPTFPHASFLQWCGALGRTQNETTLKIGHRPHRSTRTGRTPLETSVCRGPSELGDPRRGGLVSCNPSFDPKWTSLDSRPRHREGNPWT